MKSKKESHLAACKGRLSLKVISWFIDLTDSIRWHKPYALIRVKR